MGHSLPADRVRSETRRQITTRPGFAPGSKSERRPGCPRRRSNVQSVPYRGSNFLPAFRLSKFMIVLNTSGYVPIVSPR